MVFPQQDSMDNALQAVVGWLSWVTEQECKQLTRPPLPYRPKQYMRHLQVTYEAYTKHPDGTQEMNEATRHQGCDQATPSAPSVEVTVTYMDIPRHAWTDPEPPTLELPQLIQDVQTTD